MENPRVNQIIVQRRSFRAISNEPLTDEQIFSILEAGRLAPSARNEQPWRFIIARKKEDRERLCSCMPEYNSQWAGSAPLLILIAGKRTYSRDATQNRHYSFDCGAAWENMALEAEELGLTARAIGLFDMKRAQNGLGIPQDYEALIIIAIGKRGKLEDLPKDLQEKEKSRSKRKPLSELAFEGKWEAGLTPKPNGEK